MLNTIQKEENADVYGPIELPVGQYMQTLSFLGRQFECQHFQTWAQLSTHKSLLLTKTSYFHFFCIILLLGFTRLIFFISKKCHYFKNNMFIGMLWSYEILDLSPSQHMFRSIWFTPILLTKWTLISDDKNGDMDIICTLLRYEVTAFNSFPCCATMTYLTDPV